MESTSEVVYEEQTKSSVSKKSVQAVSTATATSSLVGEKSIMSIMGSDGGLVGNQIMSLQSEAAPIVTSPGVPEDGNALSTTSLQSEFSAMKLKDDYGNEIGEIVQQKEQQESRQASSSVTAVGSSSSSSKSSASLTQVSSSTTSCSKVQQSAKSIISEAQESSSSSNAAGEKRVSAEEQPEPENSPADKPLTEAEEAKKPEVDGGSSKNEETANEKKEIEQIEPISGKQNDNEVVVEEEGELEEESDDEDQVDAEKEARKEVIQAPKDEQIKTTTKTTVEKVTPEGSTSTVITTSSVYKEQPSVETTTTVITTTPASEKVASTSTAETAVKSNAGDASAKKQDETNEQAKTNADAEESAEETEVEDEEEEEEEEEDEQVSEKVVDEVKQPAKALPQQPNQDQIQTENETRSQLPTATSKEDPVVDTSPVAAQTNQQENSISSKQESLNNTIKDIISNIDSNIQAQENITALKERELELLKRQQELAKEIEQQQLLAQKLASENQYKQQLNNNNYINQESGFTTKPYQPTTNVSKYSTFEENQDNNIYSRKSETFETRESTNVSKKIDLHKIFTPATDAEEILPKNRKLYASSAFYAPGLHPTVEDQVELARRISHSLSDISNQQSRGQSMYVNRKKRSVKWVHEGSGQDDTESKNVANEEEYDQEEKENDASHHQKNTPLKFLMNPSGQMRDINSLRESINTETGLLSPDVSAEVVNALQTQKGKGAELFAKRRKVAEKWVVDENNVGAQSPSGLPDYHQYQQQPKTSTSPSILPAYTDAAKHRVQLNLHQEQLLEKYAKPGLKVVQTPWEAALNSGSASAAFVEEQKLSPFSAPPLTPSPTPQIFDASQGGIQIPSRPTVRDSYSTSYSHEDYNRYQSLPAAPQQQIYNERSAYSGTNSKRELAYKPSIPQGWKAPSMSLPKEQSVNLVELEKQTKSETNFTENEIRIVKQHQHITTVNEAAKSCEEFNTKDETELIDLICNSQIEAEPAKPAKLLLNTEVHEFVDHLIKSPELRVSPMPIRTQVMYDNAVRELHEKQLKEAKRTIKTGETHLKESSQEEQEKVNVRKQLQQYEDLHRQYVQQVQQDELMQRKREAAKLKALHQHTNKLATQPSECPPKSTAQEIAESENEESYVKVPVKDLITNFEQQCLQEEKNSIQSVTVSTSSKENQSIQNKQQTDQFNAHAKTHHEDLYMPKEIPLQSYAPPPVTNIPAPASPYSSSAAYETNEFSAYRSPNACQSEVVARPYATSTTFPVSKPYQQAFSATYGNAQPPKQQYLPPQSYQKVPQSSSQNVPQVNFNPSPLPYDKLAKFENPPADDGRYAYSPSTRTSYLNVRGSKVRNTSPAPFAASPSADSHYYGGTPNISPRPLSATQQYSGHNTPNLSYPVVTSNQLLHAPTYNTPARGWGCGGSDSASYQHPQSHLTAAKPQMVNASSMPYTDF